MIELRRVRFASIEGLVRDDLALAGEVWLRDLMAAPWATREAMKLAVHLVRYMAAPDPQILNPASIEQHINLPQEGLRQALSTMQTYGAVEAFAIERVAVKAALNLTGLQRLQVLEARHRLESLTGQRLARRGAVDRWLPQPAAPVVEPSTSAADEKAEVVGC